MANDYFNHENPLTRHTLGRAEQVNSTFNAIEAAFDKLPSPDQINRGSVAYVTDIGTVNSYVVNFARVPESYTEGMNFTMKAATTNTGASVINVNGLGAKQIRRYDGSPLQAGDIRAGQLVLMGYDGTRFLIVGVHGAEVAKARQWATSTSAVESGLLGARGYAQKADSWANANEDVVVEGGRYSAKHWALKAMSNAGLLPDENLDIPSRSYRDLGTAAEKFRDGNFSRNVSAAAFVGSGAGLTNLNASNISSGTLPNARLSGNYSFGSLTLSGSLTAGSLGITTTSSASAYINRTNQPFNASIEYRTKAGSVYAGQGAGNTFAVGDSSDLNSTSNRWMEVTSSGVTVYGTITGNGSGLTNLNANRLTSGTIPSARLSGNYSFGSLTLSGTLSAVQGVFSGDNPQITVLRPDSTINAAIRYTTTNGTVSAGAANGTVFAIGDSPDLNNTSNRWMDVTSSGVTVYGTITGNGSGLTNLNANRLTSGTIPSARLSGNYSFANLTLTGLASVSGGVSTQNLRLGSETSYAIHRNTDSSWLELAGGSDAGRGGVIRLYGPDSSDDGRLMHGGDAYLSWGSEGLRGNNGAGGLLPVATVSQTASHGTTVFPIGHSLATENDPGDINRNQSATIRLGDNAREYRVNAGSGDVVGGVWRSRGAGISGMAFERVE